MTFSVLAFRAGDTKIRQVRKTNGVDQSRTLQWRRGTLRVYCPSVSAMRAIFIFRQAIRRQARKRSSIYWGLNIRSHAIGIVNPVDATQLTLTMLACSGMIAGRIGRKRIGYGAPCVTDLIWSKEFLQIDHFCSGAGLSDMGRLQHPCNRLLLRNFSTAWLRLRFQENLAVFDCDYDDVEE